MNLAPMLSNMGSLKSRRYVLQIKQEQIKQTKNLKQVWLFSVDTKATSLNQKQVSRLAFFLIFHHLTVC